MKRYTKDGVINKTYKTEIGKRYSLLQKIYLANGYATDFGIHIKGEYSGKPYVCIQKMRIEDTLCRHNKHLAAIRKWENGKTILNGELIPYKDRKIKIHSEEEYILYLVVNYLEHEMKKL